MIAGNRTRLQRETLKHTPCQKALLSKLSYSFIRKLCMFQSRYREQKKGSKILKHEWALPIACLKIQSNVKRDHETLDSKSFHNLE